jgi:hypothetical protein
VIAPRRASSGYKIRGGGVYMSLPHPFSGAFAPHEKYRSVDSSDRFDALFAFALGIDSLHL